MMTAQASGVSGAKTAAARLDVPEAEVVRAIQESLEHCLKQTASEPALETPSLKSCRVARSTVRDESGTRREATLHISWEARERYAVKSEHTQFHAHDVYCVRQHHLIALNRIHLITSYPELQGK